jgi:hypothetical protein
VRNVAVDIGTIRWTNPKTSRHVTFDAPAMLRDDGLLDLSRGVAPEPFLFILGRAVHVTRDD